MFVDFAGRFGHDERLTNIILILRSGVRVPPGVQIQNTRVQPDDIGLFLSELRFESREEVATLLELMPGLE
jgi:hypothetical protein